MTFNRIVTGIVAGCAAVVMSAMPGLAGQMPQVLPSEATAKATPMPATTEAMLADQAKTATEMQVRKLEQMPAGKDSMPAHTEPQPGAQKPMPPDMSTMDMNPYFSAVNYPVSRDTMMVMALADFQSAR